MTREEAIQALKKEKKTALHENKVAFDMAIKALEQEPVLDKIRTEIEQLPITDTAIRLVDEILDKYKAEVEPQESEEV